jgi:hypothetical protein
LEWGWGRVLQSRIGQSGRASRKQVSIPSVLKHPRRRRRTYSTHTDSLCGNENHRSDDETSCGFIGAARTAPRWPTHLLRDLLLLLLLLLHRAPQLREGLDDAFRAGAAVHGGERRLGGVGAGRSACRPQESLENQAWKPSLETQPGKPRKPPKRLPTPTVEAFLVLCAQLRVDDLQISHRVDAVLNLRRGGGRFWGRLVAVHNPWTPWWRGYEGICWRRLLRAAVVPKGVCTHSVWVLDLRELGSH